MTNDPTPKNSNTPARAMAFLLPICVLVAACTRGPVPIKEDYESLAALPKPKAILVHEFAVSSDEVKLDKTLGPQLARLTQGSPATQEQRALGRKVANSLAATLVKHLTASGLPAQRASEAWFGPGQVLEIRGQFVSLDRGKLVIGLAPATGELRTLVQLHESSPKGQALVAEFETTADGDFKPQATETIGAGGGAQAMATASAAAAAASETNTVKALAADLETNIHRTADELTQKINELYTRKGWR